MLLLCFFNLLHTSAYAQIQHSPVVDTRATEPIRIYAMRIPFKISPIQSKYEVSFDGHAGNTWNPSGLLEYPESSDPTPVVPWEDDGPHPPYEEAPDRYMLYSADGVIRSGEWNVARKTSDHGELFATLSMFMLVGGEQVIDQGVSDRMIESFHKRWLGQDDSFRRLENKVDAAEMKFMDRKGKTFEQDRNELFLGTLNIGHRYFIDLIKNDKVLLTLSLDAQVGLPLNHFRTHLAGGASVGGAATAKVTKSYSITTALGVTAQHDQLLRVRPNRYHYPFAEEVGTYHFLFGQNIDFKKSQRLTIGVELQGMTKPLSASGRLRAPYLNPEDVGIETNYKPEYWTEARQINVTNQRRAARGLIRGSEYLALNFSYRFGKPDRAPTLSIYIQEDWTLLIDKDDKAPPLFLQFNNAQDFGAGFKITQPFRIKAPK